MNKMQDATYGGRNVSAVVMGSDPAVAWGSLLSLFP
jgi:hypothetical protein